jgi:hypothetical protein
VDTTTGPEGVTDVVTVDVLVDDFPVDPVVDVPPVEPDCVDVVDAPEPVVDAPEPVVDAVVDEGGRDVGHGIYSKSVSVPQPEGQHGPYTVVVDTAWSTQEHGHVTVASTTQSGWMQTGNSEDEQLGARTVEVIVGQPS